MLKKSSLYLPEYMIWTLGRSVENRSLDAMAIAPQRAQSLISEQPQKAFWPWILFLAGVHGDEIEGVWLLEHLRSQWIQHFPFQKVGVIVWPQANPDGVFKAQRWNAHGVDLNRNLPTKDWSPEIQNPRYPPGSNPCSEPENKALVQLLEVCQPVAILSVHSFEKFQINVNGPAKNWGETLSSVCGYPVTEDIGYPTPGCLGIYAGTERKIPTITLEIERRLSKDQVLQLHVPVGNKAVQYWEEYV